MIQETVNSLLLIEEQLNSFAREVRDAYELTGMLVTAGNGGSSSNASHLTGDLIRRGECSICATDNIPALTALSNDYSFEYSLDIFTDSLKTSYCLVLFSVSGESSNLINLAKKAQEKDIPIYSILGSEDSALARLSNKSLMVPSTDYGVVETVHLLIAHSIANKIRSVE